VRPDLGFVLDVIRRHAAALADHRGSEEHGVAEMRSHMAWYLKGYQVGGEVRRAAHLVTTLAGLDALLGQLDPAIPYPGPAAEGPRGRAGSEKRPILPEGWLNSRA
jgi:tRNA-dihydrouridine synthase